MNIGMTVSPAGIALMHYFESCELIAYPDPGSPLGKACAKAGLPMRAYRKVRDHETLSGDPWTIGWGHTGSDVFEGLVWSQELADRTYAADLRRFERDVISLVKVTLTQSQFDALVSFAYNCGSDIDVDTIAEGLGDSTLLRKVNAGDFAGAAAEFPKWNKSRGVVMAGLIRRRAAERAHFEGMPWRAAAEAIK